MLTDHEIESLVRLPKHIVSKTPSADYRSENRNRRCELELNDGNWSCSMDIESITQALQHGRTGFDVYERRPGNYQLIIPICHEDGDMVDVYLQDSPKGTDYARICDFGMTLMRLSKSLAQNKLSDFSEL